MDFLKGFKVYILTIVGLLFGSIVHAQITRSTYHDEDKSQLKEIYHVTDTFSNVLEGHYLSYYINGNIESSGKFSNNETVGIWDFYYETGKLKMRGDLSNASSDGHWTYFYENGEKSMEGEILGKKRSGEWKIYYESGELKEKGIFANGKREGSWIFYFEDGNTKGEIDYSHGKGRFKEYYPTGEKRAEGPKSGGSNVGVWKYYFKDDSLQAEGSYENGQKAGLWKYYHHNGEISAVGTFEDGEPEGQWSYYYENGKVSSKGDFVDGHKNGYWGLFYSDGTLKGEGNFNEGSGFYTEFYKSGKVKVKGNIVNGKNQDTWKYYYESGDLEGECEFVDSRGEYFGYYPDGTLQTKGTIEDDKKVGRWDLYKNDGSLSGYFRPIYEKNVLNQEDLKKAKEKRNYGVADYRYKGKDSKFNYFNSKRNEFQGVIVSANPLAAFIGRVPFALEFYMQDRLGHEFEFEGIRDPFFTDDNEVPLNETYKRGYDIAIKQKFYNTHNYGLWYFGHELRFTNVNHYANTNHVQIPDNVIRASASEQKIEYSVILGYRLMQNTASSGFTADAFISIGTGYRNFEVDDVYANLFDDLPQGQVPLAYNFGLNLGYTFSFGLRGRK